MAGAGWGGACVQERRPLKRAVHGTGMHSKISKVSTPYGRTVGQYSRSNSQ